MGIDLFTLIAQIINLVILLYLLRRFLYIPVLKAVEQRQNLIENELNEAAETSKKAHDLELKCLQKMSEIEVEKQAILANVQQEAENLSVKLSHEAKKQFEDDKKLWKSKLKAEQKTFELAIQELIVEHFRTFAIDALHQMADVKLNDLIIEKLKDKILSLSTKKRLEFSEAYKQKKEINIQSAEKLTLDKQKSLQSFITEQFGLSDKIKFKFTLNPDLVCGVSIQAEEQLISWNLANYLEEFRKNMDDEVVQLINRG